MLNSGSGHLADLQEEFKDKLLSSDQNLMNEKIYPVNEQQVSDMIDQVRAQTNQENQGPPMSNHIGGNARQRRTDFDVTPDQFKINVYEQSHAGQT